MFVGILSLGMFAEGVSGIAALISGVSPGWAFAVYICTGNLWVLGVGIILMIRADPPRDPHSERATAHQLNPSESL